MHFSSYLANDYYIFSLFQPIYLPRHLNIFIRVHMRELKLRDIFLNARTWVCAVLYIYARIICIYQKKVVNLHANLKTYVSDIRKQTMESGQK